MAPPSAIVSASDSLIRTTARIQEASEPPRQKPIIKIDLRHQQKPPPMGQHVNGIRASIDSGRDNPFRPDGEIYKLTNPIVDYYKFGPNQSRSATPTYAELDYFSSKNKRKRRAERRRSRRAQGQDGRSACWRRWLCCCCPCFCRRQADDSQQRSSHADDEEPTANATATSATTNTTTSNTKQPNRVGDSARVGLELPSQRIAIGTDLNQQDAAPAAVALSTSNGRQLKTTLASSGTDSPASRAKTQQTKKVQLEEELDATEPSSRPPAMTSSNGSASSRTGEPGSRTPQQAPVVSQEAGPPQPGATKVKTVKASKCVIS